MKILTCIKQVPDTEMELEIDERKDQLKEGSLQFDINECDDYALETALRLKEKHGGDVTVITIGGVKAYEVLHLGLAKGADKAIHITDKALEGSDSYVTAKVLAKVIGGLEYDLVLTGVQAVDDGSAQVGILLAEMLGLPHTSVVTTVDVEDSKATVLREVGGGKQEMLEIDIPAVLTIQSGIHELRYASMLGIVKARQKEVQKVSMTDLMLDPSDVGFAGSKVKIVEMMFPEKKRRAEMLEGKPDEMARKLVEKLKYEAKVI